MSVKTLRAFYKQKIIIIFISLYLMRINGINVELYKREIFHDINMVKQLFEKLPLN